MKIKQLDIRFAMNPTIPQADLEEIRKKLQEYEAESVDPVYDGDERIQRDYSVVRDRKTSSKRRFYHFLVDFKPSAPLTPWLVQCESTGVSIAGGFSYGVFETRVLPAELTELSGPWDYWSSGILKGKDYDPRYTAEIRFHGNPDGTQTRELRGLCDRLALPKKLLDHWQTTWRGKDKGGGQWPSVVLEKDFEGQIDITAEQGLVQFYNVVKEFVLRTRITEDCKPSETGLTIAEECRKYRVNIRRRISRSTAGKNAVHGPNLSVGAFQMGYCCPEKEPSKEDSRMLMNLFADFTPHTEC